MKRLAVLILFVLSLVPASPASAAQPIEAQGQYSLNVVSGECTQVGNSGTSRLTVVNAETYTGTLSGIGSSTYRINAVRTCDAPLGSGVETVHAVSHFSGTVAGQVGEFDIVWSLHVDGNFHVSGQGAITHGIGGLAGIHGVLRIDDDVCESCDFVWSYTGKIEFAP